MNALDRLLVPFALFVAISVAGCSPEPMERSGVVNISMNPDSTAFAYVLEYRHYGSSLALIPGSDAARLEVWTYDLSRRSGPRKVAGWSYDPKLSPKPLNWTRNGLFIAYYDRGNAQCERVDMRTGRRHFVGPVPWEVLRNERPSVADRNHPDDYRRAHHIEEANGEFLSWDPVAQRSTLLFALPIEETGSNRAYAIRARQTRLRQDGIQGISSVEADSTARGLMLHIRTFASRHADFVRKYTLHLEFPVPEQGEHEYHTIHGHVALMDTTVTPNPAGERFDLFVPFARFRKILRPEREYFRGYGSDYGGNLVTTLVPDSVAGDEHIPPGIRDGGVTGVWTWVEIPLR